MTGGQNSFDGESLVDLPASLWRNTAGASPVSDRPALPKHVDLTIVGAGVTGLSAAIRAAESGASVLLLEQGRIGWGASGRNGGSVVVGLRGSPQKTIMSADNAFGLVFIRLALGALVLGLIVRPKLRLLTFAQWRDAVLLGVVFAAFNVTVFLALINLPLGLVAAIGFLGPLSVSLAGSRRWDEFVWPFLGFAGVALLAPLDDTAGLSWSAIAYGLAAWAAYILASARAGRSLGGLDGFVIATAIASVLIAPLGLWDVGYFFSTWTLGLMTMVISLFAFLPLGLEFAVLKRLPPRVFGILLSLEPAIATVSGIFILHEGLTTKSWIAIAAVTIASAGATMVRERQPTTIQ